jgi:putative transposase
MPYCNLSYHIVWTTANREPCIDTRLGSRLYCYIQKNALNLGAVVFAVNGTADHVHMVVSVPSKLALADFVGKVKGVSSHDVSLDLDRRFRWQAGYGLLSFDRKRLPNYIEYVENQKRHHAEGTTIPVLERTCGAAGARVYCDVYYHLIWATKNREPMIEPRREPQLHGYLRAKACELGATVFAVNGMPDHVHMVASVPPKVALANFISQVKGFSAHEIRGHECQFRWQSEYGLFSFDRKRLPRYVSYVENQKRHHAAGTTRGVLERTSDSGLEVREQAIPYGYGADEWRRELEAWHDNEAWPATRHSSRKDLRQL